MTSKKKPAPRKGKSKEASGAKDAPSFEEALERLEALVERLEGGEIPLEESLAAYAEGTGLVKQCMERLKQAETLIQELHEDAEGFHLEPSSLGAGSRSRGRGEEGADSREDDLEDEDSDDADEAGQDEFRF